MERRLVSVLDYAFEQLGSNSSISVIDELASELGQLHDAASSAGKLRNFGVICQNHALHSLVLEDPYTRRAFEKPRGYAGDAVMLDYIYRPKNLDLSAVGQVVHNATINLPNAQSIRWRKDFFRRSISNALRTKPNAKIFSVACGHMRELDELENAGGAEFWALDQDASSLQEVVDAYPDLKIKTLNKSVSSLFRLKGVDNFDAIYSSGLFDYLSDKTAIALLRCLYGRLTDGGTLAVANFAPDSHGRGFMEGLMAWSLIYRAETDLIRLAEEGVPSATFDVFRDDPANVAYLEIHKR